MAKKIKKIEMVNPTPIQPSPSAEPTPKTPVVQPQATPTAKPAVAPKKRIRVRKKATKHLSVAVLCANPGIGRFS